MSSQRKYKYILGIESSCDDTSAAILRNDVMLSNITAGQEIHRQYGGVVPELASRAHQQHIIPVVEAAIQAAGIGKNEIDAVAFTRGPGLLGSLLVGTSFAKSFAMGLGVPIIEVNHMIGHILAHFIQEEGKEKEVPTFPFLCMTVSGGHTQLVLVKGFLEMEVIGETMDDAAGEAFDKAAKVLGLPYPGGPLIDKHAKNGDAGRFEFTFPKTEGYTYSFSGLKTQFMNFINKEKQQNPSFVEENLADICASYQKHIIDYLFMKLETLAAEMGIQDVAISGGVSANSELRSRLQQVGEKKGWNTFIPAFQYCTDNAAMIAITGYYKYLNGDFATMDIAPKARFKI
ncbi:tRNA (adenosine(37)-N6)-threonylcarbamoyltransferase complex transferase subunit TsaD [Parvicella tangerina]|uniref:tRNA N6-adenosine threonylcarbamoyltransferase n=1 Tax=Parvicella tangerina TaxID=2829795 RepID=A0A916NIG5_9FLAO|nr:tRNA (adenosine(37)-N6)-threonylcarbamoyltransferase complex transferase subunit TsaD [Parvicella tangerina]CAG5083978.1 tRNA N6-adenosine threonylcarbamoyltransferase [Parvicella tangerina]